ncbi:MAG: cation:proton antiporter [bacterium]|nr:cation:proton antiporter [bacterium]
MTYFQKVVLFSNVFLFVPVTVMASEGTTEHGNAFTYTLAVLALIVVAAKIAGAIAERFKQVSVLGELLLGVALAVPALFGFHALQELATNELVNFLSEVAVILLLFQVGLESNLQEMKRVGINSAIVAVVGVIVPFLLGTYVLAPWLFPGAGDIFGLFLGATLTATSVGITARVFKDLGVSTTKNAKVVLGAAVIDDVIGLVILAVVNGIVQSGSVHMGDVAWISVKAFAFLAVSIVLGRVLAEPISAILSRITAGIGMKMAMALAFAFGYAYLGSLFGLAPIVGAFAAGLLLDHVHFRRFSSPKFISTIQDVMEGSKDSGVIDRMHIAIEGFRERHIEDLIEDFGQWFIPIFFVMTGLSVNLAVFGNLKVLFAALALTGVAVIGKIVAGFFAGKGTDWKIVGFGMVPRGEVGLIFASIGQQSGVLNDEAFAVVVVMIILTTLITPIMLPMFLKKKEA